VGVVEEFMVFRRHPCEADEFEFPEQSIVQRLCTRTPAGQVTCS
jgi:hypothetical protein